MANRTVSVLRTHDDRLVPVAGVYELDGAAGVTLWLTQARRIGASMDRLAQALR